MFPEKEIKQNIPNIIDVYSKLFGEEYREIITDRLSKLNFLVYNNITDNDNNMSYAELYYDFLLNCKKRELTNKYSGKESPEMEAEYKAYKKSLEPFMQSIIDDENLRDQIYEQKSKELLKNLYSILPLNLKIYMAKHKLKINDIFDDCYSFLEEKSNIEYFSKEDNETLASSSEEQKNKAYYVEYFRKQFFSSLGIDINIDSTDYNELIKDKNIKNLIPSEKVVNKIIRLKKQKLQEAKLGYYKTKYDLKSYTNFDNILNNSICTSIVSAPLNFKKFSTILFFTIHPRHHGCLDYVLLHEMLHRIELFATRNKLMCGFDITSQKGATQVNPYNKSKRKYEMLNENITDIFALDALNILRSKGIYMLEPKSIAKETTLNTNTFEITNSLLKPFVYKYKKPLVKARMTGDTSDLFSQIGQENFEDLNDAINKLDYLLNFYHFDKFTYISYITNMKTDDPTILKIQNEIKRIEQIYVNMENYKQTLKPSSDNTIKESNKSFEDSSEVR